MNNTFIINADIASNSNDGQLGVEVWLNDSLVHDIAPSTEQTTVSVEVDETDGQSHVLKFVLKNKTAEHTKVDEQGNITKDAVVSIKNIKFDDIDLGNIISTLAVYTHNYNGSGPEVQEKFYDTMGCNGNVSLKFSTPFYLWLLENM